MIVTTVATCEQGTLCDGRSRNYGETAALAHALELVGERWALLVVRELLHRPQAVHRLRAGCTGSRATCSSARLKELEQRGVVERRVLPRPSGSVVYELTDYGRELEDAVLIRLAGWGTRSAGSRARATRTPARSCSVCADLPARGRARPEATYELRIGDVVATPASPTASSRSPKAPPADADLKIVADTSLRRVPSGGHSDTIALTGDPALFDRFAEIFRIEQVLGHAGV